MTVFMGLEHKPQHRVACLEAPVCHVPQCWGGMSNTEQGSRRRGWDNCKPFTGNTATRSREGARSSERGYVWAQQDLLYLYEPSKVVEHSG